MRWFEARANRGGPRRIQTSVEQWLRREKNGENTFGCRCGDLTLSPSFFHRFEVCFPFRTVSALWKSCRTHESGIYTHYKKVNKKRKHITWGSRPGFRGGNLMGGGGCGGSVPDHVGGGGMVVVPTSPWLTWKELLQMPPSSSFKRCLGPADPPTWRYFPGKESLSCCWTNCESI